MDSQSSDSLFLKVLATLNEGQARWYVAREAIRLGYGGVQAMHALTGLSRPTIRKGMRELRAGQDLGSRERVRQLGGGRKCLEVADPELTVRLERIMDENTAGDPMSLLKWTHKSTARIAAELTRQGHPISDETVRRRLKELGYSRHSGCPVSVPQCASAAIPGSQGPGVVGGHEKKGARGRVQKSGAHVASPGPAPGGQCL